MFCSRARCVGRLIGGRHGRLIVSEKKRERRTIKTEIIRCLFGTITGSRTRARHIYSGQRVEALGRSAGIEGWAVWGVRWCRRISRYTYTATATTTMYYCCTATTTTITTTTTSSSTTTAAICRKGKTTVNNQLYVCLRTMGSMSNGWVR
jgi:hypothetical protein